MSNAIKVIGGLKSCLAEDEIGFCPEDCPYKDKEWIEEGKAACRDFAQDYMQVPTTLLVDALGLIESQTEYIANLEQGIPVVALKTQQERIKELEKELEEAKHNAG